MQNLHEILRLEESVQRNVFQQISYSFSTCIESCDEKNLKMQLFGLLETVLGQIGELYTNTDAYLGKCNPESREIFLNNYCSATQPLIYAVGNDYIDDSLLEKIVKLVVYVFTQSQSVSSGGLFILHGLTVTVGERIAPHIYSFIDYLVCAINMQNTDEMGVRLACGLISDIGNHCQGTIVTFLPSIMQALERVMSGEQYETEAKIHAIIAMGDACLASEQNFA